ncbi:MAG: hypothetical protein HYY24_06230 [Verrucomicrobia bacterium]|nr:hypothetical protein [Verrucomicrobiota bacterium]
MQKELLLLVCAGLALSGCGKKDQAAAPKPTNSPAATGNPITAPVDYLGAVSKGQKSAIKTIDTASLNQAIRLFQVEEGRFPKDLNELVTEKYLPALPAAPYGMKIVYDPALGEVKVVRQ